MLLIMCHCGANRYAIDSRHVSEVLPRVNLQRVAGLPAWLAGMVVCRGTAMPVIDLAQLTEGKACPNRLSSRIVVLRTELEGSLRQFGVLAESVVLRENQDGIGEADGPAALGRLRLDEEGVFQLMDIPRLVSRERKAILFPAAREER